MTGASVAHHLLNDTHGDSQGEQKYPSVVMLEAREACWGATGRNGGHCQPVLFEHPHDPSIAHFELANFHALQNLIETKTIDCEFTAQPGVRAIYSSQVLTDIELALLTIQGTAPELAQKMRLVTKKSELESLRIPKAMGAVVTSIAARMWPYKFVSRILEDLLTSSESLSGTFNLQTLTPVQSLTPCSNEEGWTVQTPRGTILASKVVLATNAYTSHLLPSFSDLIVPCRGQMSALKPLDSVAGEKRLKTSIGFMGEGVDDYLIQRPDGRGGELMFGGGRQYGPSMGVTDDSEIDDETARYLRSNLVETLGLPEGKEMEGGGRMVVCQFCRMRKVRCSGVCPQQPCTNCVTFGAQCRSTSYKTWGTPTHKEFQATHEWTGIMGFSRDELPWIGPVPDKRNLYVAAGFTGHGMPNTWLCGKAVALMLQRGTGTLDVTVTDREIRLEALAQDVRLPRSYLVTKRRIERAMQLEDVGAKDRAEMERWRRLQKRADRPHSGYA